MEVAAAAADISAIIFDHPVVEVSSAVLAIDQNRSGDVTSAMGQQLVQFPLVGQAYQFGSISWKTDAIDTGEQFAVVTVRARLANDGREVWPESTALRIAAGNPFGLHELLVGSVAPGQVVELEMNLAVPSTAEQSHSVWVLEMHGQPFGPLLML